MSRFQPPADATPAMGGRIPDTTFAVSVDDERTGVSQRVLASYRALAEAVGDLVSEPDCPPELRAAWIAHREAIARA